MIESYSFGRMLVDGEKYRDDLMICDEEVKSGWVRKQGHLLQSDDLTWIVEKEPDLLIVGTGSSGRMNIEDGVSDSLTKHGIELWSGKTSEAADYFNEKKKDENRKIAAAFHLTC